VFKGLALDHPKGWCILLHIEARGFIVNEPWKQIWYTASGFGEVYVLNETCELRPLLEKPETLLHGKVEGSIRPTRGDLAYRRKVPEDKLSNFSQAAIGGRKEAMQ
jgi:hypothetical protein